MVRTDVVREQIERAIAARQQVRFARGHVESPSISSVYGFPLAVGDELVLVQVVSDWALDGWTILRLADVTDVRSSEFDRFAERVLAGEGELARVAPPVPDVPVASWGAAFRALLAPSGGAAPLVIVHQEEYDGEPMDVGPIVGVRDDAVLLRYVDAAGVWDDEPTEIPLADVTRVEFGDRYSTVFAKYAGPPPAG
jgi:hypothetical protein